MATMRSPTISSPDQTVRRAHLRQETPTSASDRIRFSRMRGVPTEDNPGVRTSQDCETVEGAAVSVRRAELMRERVGGLPVQPV
jgi:hypothetical protein